MSPLHARESTNEKKHSNTASVSLTPSIWISQFLYWINNFHLESFTIRFPLANNDHIHRPVRGQSSKTEFHKGQMLFIWLICWFESFFLVKLVPYPELRNLNPLNPPRWLWQPHALVAAPERKSNIEDCAAGPLFMAPTSKLPIRDVDNFNRNSFMMVNAVQFFKCRYP